MTGPRIRRGRKPTGTKRHYSFDGRHFPSGSSLCSYISVQLGHLPKQASWQVHASSKTFLVRVGGEVVFDRAFTDNGDHRIIEGKAK